MLRYDSVNPGFTFRQELSCPYFSDGRMSMVEFLLPGNDDVARFHVFLARGYRRLGHLFYRNVCRDCSACLPIRLDPAAFVLSRSQKRTLRRNKDVRVQVGPLEITGEKARLYRRYLAEKHGDELGPGLSDVERMLSMMHYGYAQVLEIDLFIGSRLVGVGIVDEGTDALSSNYFYYDTAFLDRRLGVFSILQEISLCRFLGKRYYYLGFYIGETDKMSYKKHFRPNEVLCGGSWQAYQKG